MSRSTFFLGQNFITHVMDKAIKNQPNLKIVTRFPPEPNGYLHIGHVKSILLNFGLADYYQGECYLRFDDTNPEKESDDFVRAIQEDVQWLGCQWSKTVFFASDYFEWMYQAAQALIRAGFAYVDEQNQDQIRIYRGTLTEPGVNSPYRDRPIEENMQLFIAMRKGDYEEGKMVLRAKVDMASPNINMRDPVIYRIRYLTHHRTGDAWCVYPMYTFAHPLEDAKEQVTHSICTLEFEDQRPFYDWLLNRLVDIGFLKLPLLPHQYEFSRLEMCHTITSKRFLGKLVQEGVVSGWDDPRMPTVSGMRRRGYLPSGLKQFIARVGITKSANVIAMDVLEGTIRDDLEMRVPRIMAVLRPLRVVLTNYQAQVSQNRCAAFHPQNTDFGERVIPLAQEIFIEQDDFAEVPPIGWQRLVLGGEVRLRYSYVIRCNEVIKDDQGHIIALHCSIDHDTLGKSPLGRKVKGVIHWIACHHAIPVQVRLYNRLLTVPHLNAVDYMESTHTAQLATLVDPMQNINGWVEPVVANWQPETKCQFERLGYFVTDRFDHQPNKTIVFNRTVSLKDTWQKL
ncbi:MAG: glutamine--tRNA ligase/YqeY domain fusion protein [Neisseriales bacterium]|nr:MAG: glutamine--tRNA ligase/YqeY domain fusion protein [Neisseriales bacterium]